MSADDRFQGVDTWIFDLDNTLYPAGCNLFAQVDARINAYVASHLGLETAAARLVQKRLYRQYGTTLRGLMVEQGIDPHPYLNFVHDIDLSPIQPAPRLDAALAQLPGRKLVHTNASAAYADRILTRLGIAHHFQGVFDILAADHLCKPDPRPYAMLANRYGVDPQRAAMADDLRHNLAPAAQLGMATLWIKTPDDTHAPDGDFFVADADTDDLTHWLEQWLQRN